MQPFLAIQNTYTTFEIALFIDGAMRDIHYDDKKNASSRALVALQNLLERNTLTFDMLAFIAVNQGPGPFSTLRSILATVNGLHCATNIPLVGVDGLAATLSEFHHSHYCTIALLNAFNHEVYYAYTNNGTVITGYTNISLFIAQHMLEITQHQLQKLLYFVGNGAAMYQEQITSSLGNAAYFPNPIPSLCSVEHIGLLGLKKYQEKQEAGGYLLPLYLKQHVLC